MASFDILGIGCVSVDDLLFVDAFPPPDAKVQIRRAERHFGGLAATALVAAAKLGGRCAFGGLLGHDEMSGAVEANFLQHGVDVTCAVRDSHARPIHSVIVVGAVGTRNIFFDASAPVGASASGPSEGLIRSASVLFVDHLGPEGALRAVRIARNSGVPVVADFEEGNAPPFKELLEQVDHLILPEVFARDLTGKRSAEDAVKALWNEARDTVVVTCGAKGVRYAMAKNPNEVRTFPAFPTEVIDTTGCGDVFHGAYALALARSQGVDDRIRFASAAAALKAERTGGQVGAPTAAELDRFLKKHASRGSS